MTAQVQDLKPFEGSEWSGVIYDGSKDFHNGIEKLRERLDDVIAQVKAKPADTGLLAELQALIQEKTIHHQTQAMWAKIHKDTSEAIVAKFN